MGRKKIFEGVAQKMMSLKIFPWEKKLIKNTIQEDRKKRTELIEEKGLKVIQEWISEK